MKIRVAAGGLLMAALFPLLAPVPAQSQELPRLPVPLPTSVSVPVPQLPVPVPLPTSVSLPRPLPTVNVPRPGLTPPPVVIVRTTPTPVPGPERTVIVQGEDGPVRVITRTVPGPVRTVIEIRTVTVPTPVPGPTRIVVSEKFTPGQERVVRERIREAQFKAGIAGVIAGGLVMFVLAALIYYRGFRKGELYDAEMMQRTL